MPPQPRVPIAAIATVVSVFAAAAQAQPLPPPYPIAPYEIGSSLRVQVTPNDAEVFLDGYLVGIVDDFDGFFQRLRVRPGQHEIEIYRDGYHGVRQKIFLSAGGTFRVQHDLDAIKPGETPDPRPVPATPPPDAPNRGGGRSADAHLGEASGYGSIALRVQPEGAEVLIDGETWQPAAAGERLIVQVPEGRRHVEIRMSGRRTYAQDVVVRPGETVALNVSLRSEEEK